MVRGVPHRSDRLTTSRFATERAGWGPVRARLRRVVDALRQQWIFAALLLLTWCGELVLTLDTGVSALARVPLITVMVLLALVGRWYPVRCGLLGAGTLLVGLALTGFLDVPAGPAVLPRVSVTENVAGLLLVVYAFRGLSRARATLVTAVLVAACLVVVFFRNDPPVVRSLELGLLQLVLAVGTGMYLGGGRERRSARHPLAELLRGQWPITAVLSVLLFLQVAGSDFARLPFGGALMAASSVLMSVLAVFAPLRPVQAALLGAVNIVFTSVLASLFGAVGLGAATGFPQSALGGVPVPVTAAGMLLIAFVVRTAPLREAAVATGALTISALLGAALIPGAPPYDPLSPSELLPVLFMGAVLLVLAVGTGMYFRARDEDRARAVRAAVKGAQQDERMALARELHDVVAHHVTGIVVQAQAALKVAEKNPRAASEALERISSSGTEALTAMRRLVGSMRDTETESFSAMGTEPTVDLEADLRKLVERRVRDGTGGRVELDVRLTTDVPQEVGRSALRLVQEAVTNAEKHALDADLVRISVSTVDEQLLIEVTDDGTASSGRPPGGSGGYGLVGMRERIELLGGRLSAGPGRRHGWRVEARLPLADVGEER
ncbi:Histidine kinase-, DNA gyrase B-, and HSP90-like ATPase [Actinopolyspora xinjiangensis]|uniref:histidine kinase n=1 Tax=Actinopolyspora xinjiangensis TaxID=405564 RepID=A0A1H0VRS1_9ACTN|nr:Histidine kinase-, DNA gyrase B-, and HSP90-like ATPase [Actinopolyspora xinjiangensis]